MNMPSAKMEKSRDVRRKTNTNSKLQQQSSANLIFGKCFNGGVEELVCLEKAKKEKIRRLSSVNSIQHSKIEMDTFCCCDLSSDNTENHCPSHSKHPKSTTNTKRFKIPRKFSDDCNVVDHTSVPRKLRSAMKKRSISPHSKKPNDSLTGEKLHTKDGPKKPKLNLKRGGSDWSKKAIVSGPITKDEEEVVETLYALAGMFSNGDSMEVVKSSTPPETVESPVTVLEVKKDDTKSVQAAEIVPSFTVDESFIIVPSFNRDQPDLPDRKKPHLELDSTISEMRLNTALLNLLKSEPVAEESSCIHGRDFSEPSLEAGLEQPKQQVTNLFDTKPEMAFGLTAFETQIPQQHMTREPRKNGLALWPGSSPMVPLGPQGRPSQSGAGKIPTWLDAAKHGTRTCSPEASSSTEKMQDNNKDGILQQPPWLKPHVGLKQTPLLNPNNCSNLRDATDEDRSGFITQQTVLHQEQPQAASASRMNTSQGQSFDFLSLSTGGVSTEANDSSNGVCNALESMSQFQVPYIYSHPQHQSLVPFSVPPTRSVSACTDHLSTETATPQQVNLQLPQYLGNPFCGPPYSSHSGLTKQQQQQQQLWAAHRAAQYRNHGTSTILTQFLSQQNGKPESSTLIPGAQTVVPIHSTLDAVKRKSLYFV